jgi:hypothetical protein
VDRGEAAPLYRGAGRYRAGRAGRAHGRHHARERLPAASLGAGAAFARAWDAARHHAGGLIEDIAFERAIEGVEQHVYDGNGDVVATRRIYNDRLLRFLLTHLKPERYGAGAAPAVPAAQMTRQKIAAQHARGAAACNRVDKGEKLDDGAFADMCHFPDPTLRRERAAERYR